MRKSIFTLAVCALAATVATSARAADVLWYTGHSGYDEGNAQVVAHLTGQGAVVDVVVAGALPVLTGSDYTLAFIVMPGFFNGADFFGPAEKADLNSWLLDAAHRVVMVGDWDQFYAGQAVMADLLAAIGNPIVFQPGAYDSGCGHCAGPLGDPDPITDGLGHVCYGLTPTWDPAFGTPLAYPEDGSAPGPWLVSNGTNVPCIIGIGDQNAITDPCNYLITDADMQEFVTRLYTITCAGDPVPVWESSWGKVKVTYR